MTERIRTIDISHLQGEGRAACVAEIMQACSSIGFLSITGTGGGEATRDMLRRLFALPEQAKWDQAITRETYRGFIPMGFFTPNDGSGTADKYEGYKLHDETAPTDPVVAECGLYGPTLWPHEIPEARDTILAYWQAMDGILMALLSALEEGLPCPQARRQAGLTGR